jgi:RHS repeat-associated protein
MRISIAFRILICLLVLVGLGSGQCPQVWAQGKYEVYKPKPQQLDPGTDPNSGTVTLRGGGPVCINTATDFTALSSCGGFYWEAAGAKVIRQTSTSNSSTLTLSWATPGTYVVTVYAGCSNNPSVSRSVTVVDAPSPGIITVPSSSASQVTAVSATICTGNSLQLIPPTGSSNWAWNGANILAVNSSGVATIQPSAETNTYSLTYLPSGAACTTTSTFTVNVTPAPGELVVATSELGGNWRFGAGSITLSVKNPDPGYLYKWYDDPTSTTVLQTGSSYTPSVTQSRAYYVSATTCQEASRTGVSLVVRNIQLLVAGAVPTAPVRSSNGVPVVLQASSGSSGPFTWFLNGLQINNQTGSQLSVTQPGRYTVRIQYPTDAYSEENVSQPIDVIDGLGGQTANGQALTYLSDVQVLKSGVTSADQVGQLAAVDRTQRITYLTSWAQPLQQVSVQAGPAQEDLVQHYSYAGNPTTSQTYLAFPLSSQAKAAGLYETDPLTKGNAYYAAVDTQPYGTTTTEASPLSRPVSQAEGGSVWANHPTQVSYATNTAQDGVRLWQGLDGSLVYAAGQLNKEIGLDADNRRTEVYKDSFGRVVLQRKITGYGTSPQNFDTYSVYAAAGYLQYTIPPAAVVAMTAANTWSVSSMPAGFADQWLYQYTYDGLGRLVERKFPGAAPVYLVYDKFDRTILVQDGNHRQASQWLLTKFDAQNRPVVSGLYYYNNAAPTVRQDLQALADATTLTAEFESRTSTGYTTGNTFPAVQDGANGAVLLSLTFFDDYDLNQDGNPDYTYRTQGLSSEPVASTQVRGLQTITQVRAVLPGGQYGSWLTTALFYDEYGNLIQKQSNNLLQPGSTLGDVTTLVYRQQGFVPQVLSSLKTQQTPGMTGNFSPVLSVRNRFSYDAAGRLLKSWQQHQWKNKWEPEVLVSSNGYTGLGELTMKQLHSRDGVTFLQKEDFAYNLHGQLTRINQSNLIDNPENDLFGMMLYREQTASNGNVPRYDGGITAVRWTAHNADQTNQPQRESGYVYTYDGLGRLTDATYAARTNSGTAWNMEVGAYDEKSINYDANGNIKSLQRYSKASPTASTLLLDDLSFTYTGTGNRHSKVDDLTGDATRGFKDARTSTEYEYDPNGSITRDDNKGVSYTYNTLNKVEKQTVGNSSLNYTYDAAGTVLRRETVLNGVTSKTEFYIDGFVYQVATGYTGLVSVPTTEGRALVGATTDTRLTYEYHLRDHLGNLRVAFRGQAGRQDLRLSSENPSQEEGAYPKFQNVTTTQSQGTSAYHGSYVAAVTSSQAGPGIAIPVSDQDHLKVRVYYKTPSGVQNVQSAPPIAMAAKSLSLAVAPILLSSPQVIDGRSARAAPGVQLSFTGLLSTLAQRSKTSTPQSLTSGGSPTPLAVKNAYVQWTLTDANGAVVKSGLKTAPVTSESLVSWTQLDLPLDIDLSTVATRTGTLLIQELNEGGLPVYFDSLTVTRPQDRALVTQENHYYPLGMSMSGVAVNTVPVADLSKEQFNQGSMLQDELLGTEAGIYSTFYRTYDPATGRFTGVDPLADATSNWTPYQFAIGNPISANDPTGALSQGDIAFLYSLLDGVNNSDGVGGLTLSFGGEGSGGGMADFGNLANLSRIDLRNNTYYTREASSARNLVKDNDGNFYSRDIDNYFIEVGHTFSSILASPNAYATAQISTPDWEDPNSQPTTLASVASAVNGAFDMGGGIASAHGVESIGLLRYSYATGIIGASLTGAAAVYEYKTGKADTHTFVNVTLGAVGVGLLFAGTSVAAPVVAAFGVAYFVYGLADAASDSAISNKIDNISGHLGKKILY